MRIMDRFIGQACENNYRQEKKNYLSMLSPEVHYSAICNIGEAM